MVLFGKMTLMVGIGVSVLSGVHRHNFYFKHKLEITGLQIAELVLRHIKAVGQSLEPLFLASDLIASITIVIKMFILLLVVRYGQVQLIGLVHQQQLCFI
jgi:hypothetical protein